MLPTKTLREREKELQALLAYPAGREILSALEVRYQARGGRVRPEGTSVITYILVYERAGPDYQLSERTVRLPR